MLFVTVDPERDTPEVLAQYVPAFNPTFLGLYGDAEATARVAKEFKIFYQKQPGVKPGQLHAWTTPRQLTSSTRRDGCVSSRATGRAPRRSLTTSQLLLASRRS